MTDDRELIAAIERHESTSEKFGTLADDRIKSLEYYLGDPLGNEVQGQSQVISRDVWDTIEWIKPQIADIFCSGEDVINFSPRGPEDVKAAEQETEFENEIGRGEHEGQRRHKPRAFFEGGFCRCRRRVGT